MLPYMLFYTCTDSYHEASTHSQLISFHRKRGRRLPTFSRTSALSPVRLTRRSCACLNTSTRFSLVSHLTLFASNISYLQLSTLHAQAYSQVSQVNEQNCTQSHGFHCASFISWTQSTQYVHWDHRQAFPFPHTSNINLSSRARCNTLLCHVCATFPITYLLHVPTHQIP